MPGHVPEDWVDEKTGHRVVRLSRRQGDNLSWYFHNNPFCPDRGTGEGDKMVFRGQTDRGWQLFTVNLKTLALQQLTDFQTDDVKLSEVVAKRRREAFYRKGDVLHAVNIDDGTVRHVGDLPKAFPGNLATLNADESLIAGAYGEGKEPFMEQPRSVWFTAIFEAHLRHHLFTLDVETGAINDFYQENNWLNHLQFSPTEADLLMVCHEGPWHRLHRMWQMRLSDKTPAKIHERTMDMEIAGHEFWSPDGKRLWFDLQMPKGKRFFLAGADIETGEEIRYELPAEQWSVHYTISPDGKRFAGDGGGPNSVARPNNGQWIYLFHPDGDHLHAERMCCLADHDYKLEPNVHFSPDMKWIIFRSNMHGASHVYAVEIERGY
ncbi:MAG: oligogalacturonate lyase family protein [bacterium]|nr:oligogalacturonate lyase family protein [bacterium]